MVSKAEKNKALSDEKREKLAAKSLKEIDNKWEALAFVWAFRQKEIKNIIIVIQTAIIIVLLGLYTPVFKWIFDKIMAVIK